MHFLHCLRRPFALLVHKTFHMSQQDDVQGLEQLLALMSEKEELNNAITNRDRTIANLGRKIQELHSRNQLHRKRSGDNGFANMPNSGDSQQAPTAQNTGSKDPVSRSWIQESGMLSLSKFFARFSER